MSQHDANDGNVGGPMYLDQAVITVTAFLFRASQRNVN